MFLVRVIIGRALQSSLVFGLLMMSSAALSRTDEAVPPDIVNIKPQVEQQDEIKGVAGRRRDGNGHTRVEGPAAVRSLTEVAKIEMTIRGFFEALRRDDKVAFQRLTTRSFYSFDGGKRFAGRELLKVVRDTHARGVQLNWNIGTIDIHLGYNMAWTAWENSGSAGVSTNLRPVRWLESAVLVKNEGTWKIDFLHSSRAVPPEGNSN